MICILLLQLHQRIGKKNPTTITTMNQKRKRKQPPPPLPSSSPTLASFDITYFPLLLAAAFRHGRPPPSLLRHLLRQLTLTSPPPSLPPSLLSLLPLLLSSTSACVTALSAELTGVISLVSIEQNEAIASDGDILRGLIGSLTSGSYKSVSAAVNAVMDLCVSSFARERLRSSGIVNRILYILSQENGDSRRHKLLNLFLKLTTTLINSSKTDFIYEIPSELIRKILPLFLKFLKRNSNQELAETIFRLSINTPIPTNLDSNELKSTIFGMKNSKLEDFFSNYWEKSPFLLKTGCKNSEETNSIFTSLLNKWRNSDSITDSILQDLISCPPISSDELNINNFLTELPSNSFASQLIPNQDIKIVKTLKTTPKTLKTETHFPITRNPKQLFENEGYSIALKGLQLRNDEISLVSLSLSQIFGMPSIGVNLYLSPRGAQGLARHYDDHCVLVYQLIGSKIWTVSKKSLSVLPRLYQNDGGLEEGEREGGVMVEEGEREGGVMEVLMEEGDVFYVPRGWIHEARTDINARCSLHLTFAIEVERPFEWEGFAHVAIHWWYEKLKKNSDNLCLNSEFENPNLIFTLLSHISIKLIGDHDSTFRKACLVASNCEISSQKSIFDKVISTFNENCNLIEAFNWIKLVCEKGDGNSLQCLRWLMHLDQKEPLFCNLLETLKKYVLPFSERMHEAKEGFDNFKGCFCKYVVYEDVCVSFRELLDKYRKVRGQYMKGMLSLHRRY